ncbi:MAG: alkane 1-monooxygenase [Sinobacteraceae bacterium]|nr:alkane 1-monooxygenase [Nevskiaceae bacterium]
MSKLRHLLFLLPVALPLASYALALRSGAWDATAFIVPLWYFVLIPLLDALIGRDTANPSSSMEAQLAEDRYYRTLPLLCLPLYAAVLLFGAWVLAVAPFSPLGAVAWVVSIGLVGGVVAINPAHELIHKQTRLERRAGGLLLASVSYGGFKIEHLLGHHVHVATPKDGSTARLGESVYGFVLRALWRNPLRAIELERESLARQQLSWSVLRSEVCGWYLASCGYALLCVVVTQTAGAPWWLGVAYFIGQSVVAIGLLEIINYVEHYGLLRRTITTGARAGQPERVDITHSWNSSYAFTNLLLFQLQRHSDHHAHATRRYPLLRHFDESPQLPAGYATMVVLAAMPPLWRRVMDPRVAAFRRTFSDRLV